MSRRDLIFRVFVSSTFSDLVTERNALQETVYPVLRHYFQQRGARFQAIDLRWGVSQEAALDQQTMNICIQELHRCQELSPKPNFIVLLGQRYGWMPLPPQIPADEFEDILAVIKSPDDRVLLACEDDNTDQQRCAWRPGADAPVTRNGWYRKDLNAVPHEYVLLPRVFNAPDDAEPEDLKQLRKVEQDDWSALEQRIWHIILNAIAQLDWAEDDPRRAKYAQSATHQEIRHGAFRAEAPEEHVFGYFRDITGAPADGSLADFVDADPNEIQRLRDDLEELVPDNIRKYSVQSESGRPPYDLVSATGERDGDTQSGGLPFELPANPYLAALCSHVFLDLKQVIDREIESFQSENELEREQSTHREFAEERAAHFVGREDIRRQIGDYVQSDATTPLIIHGTSGSGKTALMGRAWLDLPQGMKSVARLIGATPGSSDLRALLTSLCRELGVEEVPSDMNELVKTFRDRLSAPEESETERAERPPVILLLDALDQLNPTDNARMLYWLPRKLAPGVKLVMSVLQTEKEDEQDALRDDPFDLARRIWPESLLEVGTLDETSAATLLDAWLDEAERTLQEDQRKEVLDKFGQYPLPLYLKLAFEETRRWKSWDGVPIGLRATVDGIIEQLFERLEHPKNHGETLVSRALGYLAAGKNGLTEDELLDVLSRDKGVVSDFAARSPDSPELKEKDPLPVIVWSRLFADVNRYMTQRRADGTVVLDFYHRQVGDAVRRRYLPTEDALAQAHLHLAEYFDGLEYWAESLEAQRARARRLPPTPRPANVRKVVELPYHRLAVAKLVDPDSSNPDAVYRGSDGQDVRVWDAVADQLTNWQFLEAKAEADSNFQEQESVEPPSATDEATS